MKVIKRDGRAVDYDRQKIEIAIGKANNEVPAKERASKEEIKSIIEYIESLSKKRMLVEDIQDIIEQKLMELNKYALAKEYIVYRYTRALVRKANTTDESILGLKNIADKDLNLKITSTKWFISNLQEWNYKDKEKEFKFKLKNGEKKIFNFRKRIGIEEEKFEYFLDIDE